MINVNLNILINSPKRLRNNILEQSVNAARTAGIRALGEGGTLRGHILVSTPDGLGLPNHGSFRINTLPGLNLQSPHAATSKVLSRVIIVAREGSGFG